MRLVADLSAGRSVETPTQTTARYVTATQRSTKLTVTAPADRSPVGTSTTVTGTAVPGATVDVAAVVDATTTLATTQVGADGAFAVPVTTRAGTNTLVITATTPDGATAQTTRTVVDDVVAGTLLLDVAGPHR